MVIGNVLFLRIHARGKEPRAIERSPVCNFLAHNGLTGGNRVMDDFCQIWVQNEA